MNRIFLVLSFFLVFVNVQSAQAASKKRRCTDSDGRYHKSCLFEDTELMFSEQIYKVKAVLWDFAKTGACSDSVCFRLTIYINDFSSPVASWMASPGKKHKDGGSKTFINVRNFKKTRFYAHRIYDKTYKSKTYPKKNNGGAPMPHAVFFKYKKNGRWFPTGVAVHRKNSTNGKRLSHGCIGLKKRAAESFNLLVAEAFGIPVFGGSDNYKGNVLLDNWYDRSRAVTLRIEDN